MTSNQRNYLPGNSITQNYSEGMLAISRGEFELAISTLEKEQKGSSCYTLARGNIALVLLRLEKFAEAEREGRNALYSINMLGCPHPPSHVQFARNLCESISKQNRLNEALLEFNSCCHLANHLMDEYPDMSNEIELEKAHTMNSWGATLLNLASWKPSIDCFNIARKIYSKYSNINSIGVSEVLANLAIAYTNTNNKVEAELALSEALEIAKKNDDNDQINRIKIGLIQLDSSIISEDSVFELIENAASEAINEGRYNTAYLRLCIASSKAEKSGYIDKGLELVAKAKCLEGNMDSKDSTIASLRFLEAQLLEQKGEDNETIVKVLTEGAFIWYECLSWELNLSDFNNIASMQHDHFRLLTKYLLLRGAIKEALLSFEIGHALGFFHEIESDMFNNLIKTNSFEYKGKINTILLDQIQNDMDEGNTILIICILPPQLGAFIIEKNHIKYISLNLPTGSQQISKLNEDIMMVPTRLADGIGRRSIPSLVMEFSKLLSVNIAGNKIIEIIPYGNLHLIPWRAVLYDNGIDMNNISCSTGFNLFLRLNQSERISLEVPYALAMGYGKTYKIDLKVEADRFIEKLKKGNTNVCSKQHIIAALQSESIILISCHGEAINNSGETVLKLFLEDGEIIFDEIIPEKVLSPLVILSACESGTYSMGWGDYPSGAAPLLIKKGAKYCVVARYPIRAKFALDFFTVLGESLQRDLSVKDAFQYSIIEMLKKGYDLWTDISCLELLGRV
ncbi:CHAT domain-containing protein [Clostridium estertheticum]|uniref:CHAT domain-containing protein n=1 Tax=Clostridium estertheticum TaxID=238834 RepID=UPI001C7DC933|nr:CHAT domain-containing protein [Clostridium estertheticum]MBX4266209.1 CHAT domain-containing protein [Clostridium estertheticum]WLC89912.1 CHAT domain-containing protein [Clostridium estertheticum]